MDMNMFCLDCLGHACLDVLDYLRICWRRAAWVPGITVITHRFIPFLPATALPLPAAAPHTSARCLPPRCLPPRALPPATYTFTCRLLTCRYCRHLPAWVRTLLDAVSALTSLLEQITAAGSRRLRYRSGCRYLAAHAAATSACHTSQISRYLRCLPAAAPFLLRHLYRFLVEPLPLPHLRSGILPFYRSACADSGFTSHLFTTTCYARFLRYNLLYRFHLPLLDAVLTACLVCRACCPPCVWVGPSPPLTTTYLLLSPACHCCHLVLYVVSRSLGFLYTICRFYMLYGFCLHTVACLPDSSIP